LGGVFFVVLLKAEKIPKFG